MVLEEVERARAKVRMLLTQNNDTANEVAACDGSSQAGQGRSVDIVASKVGFKSGRQYERTRNVVKTTDALKEKGNTEDAELLTDILNVSHSTAKLFPEYSITHQNLKLHYYM